MRQGKDNDGAWLAGGRSDSTAQKKGKKERLYGVCGLLSSGPIIAEETRKGDTPQFKANAAESLGAPGKESLRVVTKREGTMPGSSLSREVYSRKRAFPISLKRTGGEIPQSLAPPQKEKRGGRNTESDEKGRRKVWKDGKS